MNDPVATKVSERESLQVAEASRETEWTRPSFLRELFLGNLRLDLIHPYPLPGPERPEFAAFYELERILREEVDPRQIDATGEYPPHVLDGAAAARRLRHEDPQGVRRARLHRTRSTRR